jgi:arylsulfatase A-like enzyme
MAGLPRRIDRFKSATLMRKPNILYIMSDDHAANAISCYRSRLASAFRTPNIPNIDRIANEGACLSSFFATNAICTPARASIMTGQYGHINGVRTLDDAWQPNGSSNLAASLQSVGYNTALFGKWHLHCEPAGFGEYKHLSGHGGQGTYHDPDFAEKDRGAVNYKGYVTDIITGMAIDWLRARDRSRPFFLICHHKAPHDLWEYPERHEHLFDGIDVPVPDSLFEDKSHRSLASRDFGASVMPRSKVRNLYEMFCMPDHVTGPLTGTENLTFEEKGIAAYHKYLRDYLRTVAGIDDSVGALLAELEGQGILDDTVVIYTSDQGMFLGSRTSCSGALRDSDRSLEAHLLLRSAPGRKRRTGRADTRGLGALRHGDGSVRTVQRLLRASLHRNCQGTAPEAGRGQATVWRHRRAVPGAVGAIQDGGVTLALCRRPQDNRTIEASNAVPRTGLSMGS